MPVPTLEYEAFEALRDPGEFAEASNGGYFVEGDCRAHPSGDIIEAHWCAVGLGDEESASYFMQVNKEGHEP